LVRKKNRRKNDQVVPRKLRKDAARARVKERQKEVKPLLKKGSGLN